MPLASHLGNCGMPDEALLESRPEKRSGMGGCHRGVLTACSVGLGPDSPALSVANRCPTEMAIGLEFNRQDGTPDPEQYHFHHRCYVAWEFERGGAFMVELILSEAHLACLKAIVTIGSEKSAALGRHTLWQ